MEERRRDARRRSLLSGRIVFDDYRCTFDCMIRNVSLHGAMVVLSAAFRMPENFDIAIPDRDETHHATLMWRRGQSAGLALAPVRAAAGESKPRFRPQGRGRPEKPGFNLGY
jgi:PilZ domain